MSELDRGRVDRLAAQVMAPIAANFRAGPPSPDRVFEGLNALAYGAATAIVGAGNFDARQHTRAFFIKALEENITTLLQDPRWQNVFQQ